MGLDMDDSDRRQLIRLVENRIDELEEWLSESKTFSDKKKTQDGDAAADMDLKISASVDEKVMADHALERRRLYQSLEWLKGEDAGLCYECGCKIPLERLRTVLDTRLCVNCAAAGQ
jgi:RNA polymerase-binding transcription factor DksA